MTITIQENFLPAHKFMKLQETFMGPYFPWYYNSYIALEGKEDKKYQLVHTFFNNGKVNSDGFSLLEPVWDLINPKKIIRAKINLGPVEPDQEEGGWHTDFTVENPEAKDITTAVFYINDNNGYTKFKDGTVVESVANRFASFPALTPHTGVSHTDAKVRVVLNLNYISY